MAEGFAYFIEVEDRTRYLMGEEDCLVSSARMTAFLWRRFFACCLALDLSIECPAVLAEGRDFGAGDDRREIGEVGLDMGNAGRVGDELGASIGELGMGELDGGGMGDDDASRSSWIELGEAGGTVGAAQSMDISERQSEREDIEDTLDLLGETGGDSYDNGTPSLSPTP